MKKEAKPLNLSYPRELQIFREFVIRRKNIIEGDFVYILEEILKQKEISKEEAENKLVEIKNKLREILGSKDIEYFTTTIHLRPRAIDYLSLGLQRIEQAIENPEKIFHYPVYYQGFESERPDLIYIGNYCFSLCEIIPTFREKKNKGEFQTSLDFHNALLEYLQSENWQEEIRLNLEKFIEKEFSNYKKNLRALIFENIYDVVISILSDYKNFFEENNIKWKPSEIFEINKQLAEVLLENFVFLEPILSKVGIQKEYLEDIKEGRVTKITAEFIFVICVLSNLVHIGAEYGKFNDLREKLGLPTMEEPPKESPQERFRFFEVRSEKEAENDTLRFLLGIESKEVFINVAKYEGLEGKPSSPIKEHIRKRIRVLDFYLKFKENFPKIKDSLETVYFPKEDFINLLKQINYFSHLNEKEKEIVEKILEKLEKERNNNLNEWIKIYNDKLEAEVKTPDEIKVSRLKISLDLFYKKLLIFIFKNYVQGNFEIIQKELPKEIFEYFLTEKIEKLETFKELPSEAELFYGVILPLKIDNFLKDDIINFTCLLKIVDENFDEKISMTLFPQLK